MIIASDPRIAHLCGWRGADAVQRVVAAHLPTLHERAGHLFGSADPTEPILLYPAWQHALGRDPGYPAQQIGDCISFGHGHANDLLQAIEIGLNRMQATDYEETCTEFIYGASREVAGILGTGDGSYGAAAVKAMMTVGTVSRLSLGADGVYSGARAKKWGLTGPPGAIEEAAKPYQLGAGALVSTWAGLVVAMRCLSPVTICTQQGFSLVRDSSGFCPPQGTWGHCMCIAGIRFDRPGALILQSWGPDLPSGPTALDQPTWSFWADRAVIEGILSEGDNWALSKGASFVARPMPPTWRYGSAS